MIIQIDTRQQPKPHNKQIEQYFQDQGYKTVHSKIICGDYCIPNKTNIAVDTKQDISELYGNLITDHERFARECKLAKECGIKLYILTSNRNGIRTLEDLTRWQNPRMIVYRNKWNIARKYGYKTPTPPPKNETLIKIMQTMEKSYGVEFLFCNEKETGKRILELLMPQRNEVKED